MPGANRDRCPYLVTNPLRMPHVDQRSRSRPCVRQRSRRRCRSRGPAYPGRRRSPSPYAGARCRESDATATRNRSRCGGTRVAPAGKRRASTCHADRSTGRQCPWSPSCANRIADIVSPATRNVAASTWPRTSPAGVSVRSNSSRNPSPTRRSRLMSTRYSKISATDQASFHPRAQRQDARRRRSPARHRGWRRSFRMTTGIGAWPTASIDCGTAGAPSSSGRPDGASRRRGLPRVDRWHRSNRRQRERRHQGRTRWRGPRWRQSICLRMNVGISMSLRSCGGVGGLVGRAGEGAGQAAHVGRSSRAPPYPTARAAGAPMGTESPAALC